jgi:hypothetical protein
MKLKKIFGKLLGKNTADANKSNDPSLIKFDASAIVAAPARTFATQTTKTDAHLTNLVINIPVEQFPLYDAAKIVVQQQAATIATPNSLDIVVLIKERQEALHHIVNFLKNIGFPPSDQNNAIYTTLTPLIQTGENAGKINRNARYGNFKDQQQEIITYFDGSGHGKAHFLNDGKENQKLLILLSWVTALKNFGLTKPLEYAKLINGLIATQNPQQIKLAKAMVFLAESNLTDAILSYTGTVRNPEFKVLIENAIREWYQGCNLVCL